MLANANPEVSGRGQRGYGVKGQVPEKGEVILSKRHGCAVYRGRKLSETTVVPNFIGKTMSQANIAAANARLNLQISGLGLHSSEAKSRQPEYRTGQESAARNSDKG